jgi:AraC-like DNA-binding protein
MPLIVDTTTVPGPDRFDYWAAEHGRVLHPLALRRPGSGPFNGRIRAHGVGPLTVYRIEGEASTIERTHRLVARRDPEELQITHLVRGRFRIEQAGRVAVVGSGDVSGYETSHPYEVQSAGPFELLLFSVPRRLLGAEADRICAHTAVALDGRRGPAALAGPFLRGLADRVQDGSLDADGAVLADCVVDLARLLFAGTRDPEPPPESDPLFPQVLAYIEAHLGDRALGPRTIAAAHFVSPRRLHKAFEAQGHTVAGWIRERRLEAVRRDLLDPRLVERPIRALAAARGFGDAPHFSRLFRRVEGCTPGEFRERAGRP